MEQLVFKPFIFYMLSGLPSPKNYQPLDLTPEERNELQTLYNETVSNAKVAKVHASVSNGNPQGQSLADHNRLSPAAIGRDPLPGFPHKPDPAQCLKDRGYRVRIVQLEGSTLQPQDLLSGFDKMNSKRSLWLKDLEDGLFKIEKDVDSDKGSKNEPVVMNTASFEGEDQEWGGIPDSTQLLEDSVLSDRELGVANDDTDLPDEIDC
ncbi:hypothetical protein DFH28DRAFT_914050 [Melampsora americana]|nr:hypothetical protein DFH28DRAFT_914050 [Melampsora americana]